MPNLFQSKLNCEVLDDDLAFEVRWAVAGDSIVLQLVAKLEDREYMSFGISGDDSKTVMVGSDVVVAWVDKDTLKGYADDYYLEAKAQCSGPTGSCPDDRLEENSNNIRLLNAAMVNGYSIVTYQRPLKSSDHFDKEIVTNSSQSVVWAIGPLNQRNEVSFHSEWAKQDRFIDFGRPPKWNCPMPETEQPSMKSDTKQQVQEVQEPAEEDYEEETQPPPPPPPPTRSRGQQRRRGESRVTTRGDPEARDSERSVSRTRQTERRGPNRGADRTPARRIPTPAPVPKTNAWDIPPIQCYEPEDGVFYAQMGPTGGKRGYPAITGHVGWGISWYINGLLIPEVNLVRGKTYTFVIEGGQDPDIPAKYHPFYITDDAVGGYAYKTPEERAKVKIFAGARQDANGDVEPIGVGRLCHWTHQGDLEADEFESFGAYQRTLELKCDQGEPGVIQFTPDKNTPDTVYYQCFTHRYLGWKINILDSCDETPAASEAKRSVVNPNTGESVNLEESDLEESPSVRVETKVKAPNQIDRTTKEENVTKSIQVSTTSTPLQILGKTVPSIIPVVIHGEPAFPQPVYFTSPFASTYNPFSFSSFHMNTAQTFKPSPTIPAFPEEASSTKSEVVSATTLEQATSTTQKAPISTTAKTEQKSNSTFLKIPQTSLKYGRPYGPPQRPVSKYQPPKKTYRPNMKLTTRPFPYRFKDKPTFLIPMQSQLRPQSVMVIKRPPHPQPAPSTKKKRLPPTIFGEKLKRQPNVEVSLPQPSTEKELSKTTEKPYAPLIYIAPSKVHYNNQYRFSNLPPAINTGFRPESIVVEGGFKPIISKDIEERADETNGPELKYESEIGVIDQEEPQLPQPFEPMFIPSPLDKLTNRNKPQKPIKKIYRKNAVMFVIKKRGERRNVDDEIAEAAEHVDTYYLPPANNKEKPTSHRPMQPSNIDIPPGTVVSYDGRRVSGASLTARIDRGSVLDNRASKAAELVKAGPQFGPFRGDLPPLDPQIINQNVPQLHNQGVLNRDLESPSYLPQETPKKSTKLILVRQYDGQRGGRGKRAAHHTPEHTAEQERAKNNTTDPNSARRSTVSTLTCISALLLVKLLQL